MGLPEAEGVAVWVHLSPGRGGSLSFTLSAMTWGCPDRLVCFAGRTESRGLCA